MPIIKTEVSKQTRAKVAYLAALLELPERSIYGLLLDDLANRNTLDVLGEMLRNPVSNQQEANNGKSRDSQQDVADHHQ